MTDERIIDMSGVRLPTDGWVDVPNAPFQVCAHGYDMAGTFHVRARPADDLTVPRAAIGSDWDPESFVFLRRGEYRVGFSWTALGLDNCTAGAVEPEAARRAAARLLAIAEIAERRQTEDLENR